MHLLHGEIRNVYISDFLRSLRLLVLESRSDVKELIMLWNSIFFNLIRDRFSRSLLLLLQSIRMNE